MEIKIPEIEAREILETYDGANNQILEWQQKYKNVKNFKIARTQARYILENHEKTPKVVRRYLDIVQRFGESLQEKKLLPKAPSKIWAEKLLAETDKAYHIWGKVIDSEKLYGIWIPKAAIIPEEKKLDHEIDYSKYSTRPLMEHQKIAVEKLLSNNRYILADDMGLGKFLPVDTFIYTPFGKVKIGNIKINDYVIGSDGKPYKVTGVFPQGKKETYKITFNDGFSILAGDEHLWSVSSPNYSKNRNNNRNKKSLILSTKQMFDKNSEILINGTNNNRKYKIKTYYKSPNGNNKWQIPISQPIQFYNNDKLPIDPYLFGLSLGDGSFNKNGVKFSVHKDDYDELFNNFILNEHKPRGNNRIGYINLKKIIEELNIENFRSHNKYIPDVFKYSSVENRLSLLQGLMDTDGHCMLSKNNTFNGTEYSTVSEKLCDDVCEIVHTLGGIARKKERKSYYKKNGKKIECRKSYRVNIKLPNGMIPFRLNRKKTLYNEPKKYPVGRYIKKIEKDKEYECVCISIDSPDKLYVAEHAIVTHNTTSAVIASLESNVKKVLIVCPASLKLNWKREIEVYTRKKILIVEGRKWGSTFDYYIINYDILKNFHTTDKTEDSDAYKLIMKENFDIAIVDEAHYISNPTAKRTKLMNDILEKIPKVWLLTGTPMTSRPINYYNLLKIVHSPLTLNWQTYVRRYCKGYQFRVNGRKIWNTSGASNLDELRDATKNVVLRRMKTDVLDLPEKIIIPVSLELNSSFYNEEFEDFIKISEEQKGHESIAITLNRLMKIRQIIAIEKVAYTSEIIDKFIEQDKKVIVFTNFTMSLDMLHEKYKKNSVILDGRMSKDKRQESVDKFQTQKKIKVFIANIKAGGVGINLTEAEGVIMNDLSFVPSDHTQAEDRAYRYGQKKGVVVYYPIFENTVEQIIYNILQKKKDIIDQVMGDGEYSESFSKELIKKLL